jgi:hypothetical protein
MRRGLDSIWKPVPIQSELYHIETVLYFLLSPTERFQFQSLGSLNRPVFLVKTPPYIENDSLEVPGGPDLTKVHGV